MAGIINALSDEFYKMGTFSDDFYKNVIQLYKQGKISKPNFIQALKNWRPHKAFMPQSMGGTFFTKPTPMASKFLKYGNPLLAGLTTLFQSTPANAGEQEFMDAINEQQAVMAAGQQALGQTQPQIQAQQAASQATQQDNYQAPTMSQQQMVQEAQQTGGTVNPHEATQAAWTPPASKQPVYGPHGKAHGGMVGMNYLTRRL